MDKIKKKFSAMPLRKAIGLAFFTALLCSGILTGAAVFKIHQLQESMLREKKLVFHEQENTLAYETFTASEAALYYGCNAAMAVLPAGIFFLGITASSCAVYRLKLQKPLRELHNGITRITSDNLDFSISYESEDELGRLCHSMERMRRELCRSKKKTWELMQHERLLYASLAHDLRTPLTVLKGYLEYLESDCLKDAGQKEETVLKLPYDSFHTAVCGMGEAVRRLEQYVSSMRDIDRMEHVKIRKQAERV